MNLLVVDIREDCDLVSQQNSALFDSLGTQGKRLSQIILQGQRVFEQGFIRHATVMQNVYLTTETNIKQHVDQRQAEIIQAVTQKQNREQRKDDQRRQNAILEHLSFPTMEVRYETIDPAHTETFAWIFNGGAFGFSDWLEGTDESLYWINGKAGSGKSTLMKYIVDNPRTKLRLRKWAGERELIIASFFFWISGTKDQCSQTGLLRSLLHYLLDIEEHRHLVQDIFPDMWKRLNDPYKSIQLRAWTVSYASKALKDLLGRNLGKVALFIDGLDEYHGDHHHHLSADRHEHYGEIVGLIKSLTSSNRADVKICFSSRPYQIFHNNFDQVPKLRLQDLTHGDIYTYTNDMLVTCTLEANLDPILKCRIPQLASSVVEQAQGVFLWVRLVIKSLVNGIDNLDDFETLQSRLKRIPSDLMDLYSHLLEKIEPQYLVEGCRIFDIADTAFRMTRRQQCGSKNRAR